MKIKFTNGSTIEAIKNNNTNIRGNRSNYISCNCYDLDNNEIVFVEDLDLRKPFTRFVPEWYLINESNVK